MKTRAFELLRKGVALLCVFLMTVTPGLAQEVITTPTVPLELPVEVELELAPGSLKEAPLWFELAELLEDPYAFECPDAEAPNECIASTERRPSFLPPGCSYELSAQVLGVPACEQTAQQRMPSLKIWHPNHNVLTGQPLRLRTSDGEISWDQPGPLFGPDDGDPTTPVTEVIGRLVALANGNLRLRNPQDNPDLPPDFTVVATPAFNDEGEILDEDGEEVTEFELPISELDFLRSPNNQEGVPEIQVAYIGRPAAEVLGKALFWDMQVGKRRRPGLRHVPLPRRRRQPHQEPAQPEPPGRATYSFEVKRRQRGGSSPATSPSTSWQPGRRRRAAAEPGQRRDDANDVMSSMGVRFQQFAEHPVDRHRVLRSPPSNGVRSPRARSAATPCPDPIPVMQGLRRVEPRNTPTMLRRGLQLRQLLGRARPPRFNGGSVFGPADPQVHVFIDPGTGTGANRLPRRDQGHFREELERGGARDRRAARPDPVLEPGVAGDGPGAQRLRDVLRRPQLAEDRQEAAARRRGSNSNGAPQQPLRIARTPSCPWPTSWWPTDSRLGPFSNQSTVLRDARIGAAGGRDRSRGCASPTAT